MHRAQALSREFREDVIRVARNCESGVLLKQVAADVGISESCLNNWLAKADREDGVRLGDPQQAASERELRKRIRLLGGGVSVVGEPAGKLIYPLVRVLAATGAPIRVPVAVTCRVLKVARQPFYRCLAQPLTALEWDQALLANAALHS